MPPNAPRNGGGLLSPTHHRKSKNKVVAMLRVALLSVWTLAALLSFVLDVVADVFQADTPTFPLVPVAGTGIGLQVIATAVTVLYGCVTIPHYRAFQPFSGGQRFVFTQCAGFCLATVVAVAKVVLLEVHPHNPDSERRRVPAQAVLFRTPYGAFTSLGVFAVLSQGLLMNSHHYFKRPVRATAKSASSPSSALTPSASHTVPARSWKSSVSQLPYRDYLLVLVGDTVIFLCTFVAAYQPTFRPVNVVVLFTFTTLTILLLQFSTAPSITTSYRLLHPFTRGAPFEFIVIQCTANLLLLVFYADLAVLFRAGASASPSWHMRCALIGIMTTTFHAVLLRVLQFVWQTYRAMEAKSAEGLPAPQSALVFASTVAAMTSVEKVAFSGTPSVLSAVSVTASLIVFGVQGFLDTVPSWASGETQRGLRLLIQFASVVLFVLPPLTFLQGSFFYGKRFSLWGSHRGSLDYLSAQVAGWWCYCVAFFCAVLQLTQSEMSPSLTLLSAACVLFAQLLIHSALYLFLEEGTSKSTFSSVAADTARALPLTDAVKPTGASSQTPSKPSLQTKAPTTDAEAGNDVSFAPSGAADERTALAHVLNVEMLVAIALMLLSVLLRLVFDMVVLFATLGDLSSAAGANGRRQSLFEKRDGVFYFVGDTPMTSFLTLSRWLALVAPVIAHMSIRDRIPLLHGTSLANGYVALQTLGWLAYITLAASTVTHDVAGVPLLVLPWLETIKTGGSDTVPIIHVWGHAVPITSTETVTGLLYAIPFVCVVWSNLVETSFEMVRARVAPQVAVHVDHLLSVIAKHETSPSIVQECVDDISVIAGPRLGKRFVEAGGGRTYAAAAVLLRDEENEKIALVDAAHYTTILTTTATVSASVFAFMASDVQPFMALLLSTAAVLVGAFSCGAAQAVYGPRYHLRSGVFHVFMPFAGGRRFVLRQTCGWVGLAICFCTLIACYLEQHVSHFAILVLTVTNVLAQWMVCGSIPHFDPEAVKDLSRTFVGKYAEAILALATLIATVFFIQVYALAAEKRATSQVTSLVPLVFSSIAMCLVIPFGLLSLQRQSAVYGLRNPLHYMVAQSRSTSPFGPSGVGARWSQSDLTDAAGVNRHVDGDESMESSDTDSDIDYGDSSDDSASEQVETSGETRSQSGAGLAGSPSTATMEASLFTPLLERWNSSMGPWDLPVAASQPGSPASPPGSAATRRRRRRHLRRARRNALWMRTAYVLSGVLAVFVAMLIPFGIAFIAYAYTHSVLPTLEAAVWVVQILSLSFAALIVFPILFKSVVERSRAVRNAHSAVCSFLIYSIPTITVLGGLLPGLVLNTRGAWLFTLNMVLLAVFSTLPHVLVTSFVFIVSSFGYFAHYHLYVCLYKQRYPFAPGQCASDIGMALFWLWYSRRYLGRPHMTGRLQSAAVSSFFRRNFFEGMSYYFSLRIIRSDSCVLSQEKGEIGDRADASCVDLRNPANQYIFSFHPHGVFPGSAMFVPKTTLWEKTMGSNEKNFISTHCADIVFSVPLMREFPLTLGAMSVSRRGIENSLKHGNSPLIVTGGQSDMLLTRMSETEMHLVCHHLGFIRIALQHKVPLVPLLSFSESNILDNVHCIHVQRWFLKRIGFPFPTLPRGRWGLPLPTCKPLTLVVGQPLYPLPGRDDPEDPSCVDEMRTRYFEHLEVLFYKHRAEAGYPNMKLYLHNGVYNEGVLAVPPEDVLSSSVRKGDSEKANPSASTAPGAGNSEAEEELLTHQTSAVRRALAMPGRHKKRVDAPASAARASSAKRTQ